MINRTKLRQTVLYATLLIVGLLMMVPFFWLIFGAFKTGQEIRMIPPTLFPHDFTVANFQRLFSEEHLRLGLYYRNSLVVSCSTVALQLFSSALLGYVFAKFQFPGKQPFFWFIMSTMIVPYQVTLIPNYLILSHLRLINTLWALILPSAVGAFGIFLMQQFMLGIPNSYLDSARLEGASEFTIFLRIAAPLSKPALATVGMMTFMWTWNSYLWPTIVLTSDELRTLPIILYWFSNSAAHETKLHLISAASVLVIFPILIVFVFTQRWIIKGMTLTGIK